MAKVFGRKSRSTTKEAKQVIRNEIKENAVTLGEQKIMLGKIYGKNNVKQWDDEKVHNTYKNLIERESQAMATEREKRRIARKAKAAQKKAVQKEQTAKRKAARKAKTTVKKATAPKPKTTAKAKTAKKKK